MAPFSHSLPADQKNLLYGEVLLDKYSGAEKVAAGLNWAPTQVS